MNAYDRALLVQSFGPWVALGAPGSRREVVSGLPGLTNLQPAGECGQFGHAVADMQVGGPGRPEVGHGTPANNQWRLAGGEVVGEVVEGFGVR